MQTNRKDGYVDTLTTRVEGTTFPPQIWAGDPNGRLGITGLSDDGTDRLETIVTMLLLELGVDIGSQHFRDTAKRVARFYREFTRGNRVNAAELLKTFRSRATELIVVSGIDFFSLCPHHLLPYSGSVDFGYIPAGRIVGVSKVPRLIRALAARPVVQEDLAADIADAFMSEVKPLGCAVKIAGKHSCVAARGVHCPGVFAQDHRHAAEFYQAIGSGGGCIR